MSWENMLPDDVAVRHEAYVRRQRVLRANRLGLSWRIIAERVGLSTSRIQQLCQKAGRDSKISPAEHYLAGGYVDLEEITAALNRQIVDPCANDVGS